MIEQGLEFQGHEELKAPQVKGLYGVDQFLVDAEDKGHGPARNTRYNVGGAHTKALCGQYQIVEGGPVFFVR